ncbi:MAG: hypothetical protein HY320_14670 [Armatimonadetes bacterium]|nr:hypothetical protein [Armatimonadota bacterium]
MLLDSEEELRLKKSPWKRTGILGALIPLDHPAGGDINHPVVSRLLEAGKHTVCLWIARRVCRHRCAAEFAWVVAHELRHAQQRQTCPVMLGADRLALRPHLRQLSLPRLEITLPSELDADLTAWRVTRSILGQAVADAYVREQAEDGPAMDCYRALQAMDSDEPYDAPQETLALLRHHRRRLTCLIRESCDLDVFGYRVGDAIRKLEDAGPGALPQTP